MSNKDAKAQRYNGVITEKLNNEGLGVGIFT